MVWDYKFKLIRPPSSAVNRYINVQKLIFIDIHIHVQVADCKLQLSYWCGVTIQQPCREQFTLETPVAGVIINLGEDHLNLDSGHSLLPHQTVALVRKFVHLCCTCSNRKLRISIHSDPSNFRFGRLDILVAEAHAVLVELVEVWLDNLGHDEGGLLDPLSLPCDCYHHIIGSYL